MPEVLESPKLGLIGRVKAAGKVLVTVALNQRDGAPEDRASLAGELRHPADENRDRALRFSQVTPGLYRAELAGVAPGNWDVLVSNKGSDSFQASRRLWVP